MVYHVPLDFKGNRHPAKLAANAAYKLLMKHGSLILVKDTGAGGTTGMCAAAIDAGQRPLLVGPLRISVDEVLKSSIKYIDNEQVKTMLDKCNVETHSLIKEREAHYLRGEDGRIDHDPEFIKSGRQAEIEERLAALEEMSTILRTYPTNRDCPNIRKLISENNELEDWDVFTVNCKECEGKESCQVYQSVNIHPDDNTLGYGITYAGIIASMLSMYRDMYTKPEEPSLGHKRIDKIMDTCDPIFIDECHCLEFMSPVSLAIHNVTDDVTIHYGSVFYELMCTPGDRYTEIKELITNTDILIRDEDTKTAIQQCIDENKKEDNSSRLLNVKIKNKRRINLDDPKAFGKYVEMNQELIDLHIDKQRPVDKLSNIKNILLPLTKIMATEWIDVQLEWSGGKWFVNLVADNAIEKEALDDFIRMCVDAKKKVCFITATKGTYNYNKYLEKGGHIKTVLMGEGGDPTDSAGEQLILCDTWKMGADNKTNSFTSKYPEIRGDVLDILKQTGKKRAVLVCRKVREANQIRKMIKDELGWVHDTEHRKAENDVIVTYYRGPDSHSGRFFFYTKIIDYTGRVHWEKSPADVMILIGGADTPGHVMDRYSKTAKESREKRQIEIYMQMFQMCGRIKGNGRSLVYCIGVNSETVHNFTTWGTEYKLTIDDNPTRPKCSIEVQRPINKPSILECKSHKERLERGRLYLFGFLGVIKYADIGKTEFLSQNWDSIMKKQIQVRQGFLARFDQHQFRQLPKLPASVKSIQLLSERIGENKIKDSLLYIYRESGVKTRDQNLIILETDTDLQILNVGEKSLRTPADITNFSGSLLCGSIEIVEQLLNHYLGAEWKEIERSQAENRLRAIMDQVRVASEPVQVPDGLTFLKEIFCGCSTRYAVRTKTTSGWGYFTARKYGKDREIDDQVLLDHMAGKHTALTYTINDDDLVRHITFDVDAHEKEGSDTLDQYKAKLEAAKTKRAIIVGLLKNMGMDPLLIKSGSLGSYHIVLVCLPVSADKAHYFANCVMEAAGYPDSRTNERFPKQPTCQIFYGRDEVPYDELEMVRATANIRRDLLGPTVDETPIENYMGYGNGTKIPFCADRKNGSWVYVYHPEEKKYCRYLVRAIDNGFDPLMYWVDEDGNPLERQYMPVRAIDLSGIEVPEEAKPVPDRIVTTAPTTAPKEMRPFFKWILKQGNLIHTAGHYLRVALFYELAYRCKMTDQQILEVFRGMGLSDFSETKTLDNIRSTRAVGHTRPYSMAKVRALLSEENWQNYQAGRPYVPDDYRP